MPQSKTITIVLADGDSQGFRSAEITNRSARVVAFPRSDLASALKKEDLGKTGVYLLVGENNDSNIWARVYIGVSDDLRTRLKQHDSGSKKKDFWSNAYLIFNKDDHFLNTHAEYLESKYIGYAKSITQIKVENSNDGKNPKLSTSAVDSVNEFFEFSITLVSVLGFNLLNAKNKDGDSSKKNSSIMYEMNISGACATMVERNNEFVVQKGSTVRANETPSAGDSVRNLRSKLKADGTLIPKGADLLEFTEDCTFAKISAAASVVAGGNQNGNQTWVVKGTKTTYGSVASQNGSS